MIKKQQKIYLTELVGELKNKLGVKPTEASQDLSLRLHHGEVVPDSQWRVRDYPEFEKKVFEDEDYIAQLREAYQNLSEMYQNFERKLAEYNKKRS